MKKTAKLAAGLASTALLAGSAITLTAQPASAYGRVWTEYTYYSDSTLTREVGTRAYGCIHWSSGQQTAYYTAETNTCGWPGNLGAN